MPQSRIRQNRNCESILLWSAVTRVVPRYKVILQQTFTRTSSRLLFPADLVESFGTHLAQQLLHSLLPLVIRD